MKQLHRIIVAFFLVLFVAGFAYAQSEDNEISSVQFDTCASFRDGCIFLERGKDGIRRNWLPESRFNLKDAVSSFERHLLEHPCHDSTAYYLGYSYYLLSLLDSTSNQTSLVDDYHQNTKYDRIARFKMHYYCGFNSYFGDTMRGIEPDYCEAFDEFNKALAYIDDLGLSADLRPFYKNLYYQHACLLFDAYHNSNGVPDNSYICNEIIEQPDWISCMGEQPLDHCIDDLSRLVNIDQEDIEKNNYDTLALVLLGECYSYKGEYEKAKECYEKSGNPSLYAEKTFLKHYNQAVSLYYGDTLNCVEPDYCGAFQELDKAIACNINYHECKDYVLIYKSALSCRANLLFLSHVNNLPDTRNLCGGTKEKTIWDTCIGGHQLDRCIDDLNRLIDIEQEDQMDPNTLVRLGECYYYKGEYKKATECYEKSSIVPSQLDIIPATFFWDAYNKQGIIENEQTKALIETTVEGWRNNPTYYRLLYLDDGNYENSLGEMSELAHFFIGYYIDKEEYDKAFDFWNKIKNNFSLDTTLIYYEGRCRYFLGDPAAIEQMEFAIRMNPTSSKLHSEYLAMQMLQGKLSSTMPWGNAGFAPKQNDTLYYMLKGVACYYEKNYYAAKEYYDEVYNLDPSPYNALMLALCYQKIVETKSHPETRQLDSMYARKYFQVVVSKEEMIGKYSYAPYAYYYLNDYDKSVEIMEDILNTELVSPAISEKDKETCHDIHYQTAEIYALVGNKKKAKKHFKKALEYQHDPLVLTLAERAPLLTRIHKYVEKEIGRYKKQQGTTVSPIHRDTLFCDIPFEKNGNYNTKTINCKINGKQVNNMLFDPGADYIQLTPQWAFDSIGIVDEDIIGCLSPKDANGKKNGLQLLSLKTVEFGDIVLENVQALVNPNPNAPLLLGCTVLNNLKVEMPSPVNKGMIRLTYIKESIEIPENKKK